MIDDLRVTLRCISNAAQASLGECAEKITNVTSKKPSPDDLIRVRALGIARDQLRWATALEALSFVTKRERQSARVAGITEWVRFVQTWTAANALFSRDEILQLVTTPHPDWGEGRRFQEFFKASNIERTFADERLAALHETLDIECKAQGVVRKITAAKPPRRAKGREQRPFNREYKRNLNIDRHPLYRAKRLGAASEPPTMWEVIDQKYTRPQDRTRRHSIGEAISTALTKGEWPRPPAALMIYGARNWTVHGMLLTSFFRGSKAKYPTFIINVQLLLAASLDGFAQTILPLV